VWKPPYEVEAPTGLLRGAEYNTIRVVGGEFGDQRGWPGDLAAQLPVFSNLRYGERFQEQDMQNVPAGSVAGCWGGDAAVR